MVQQLEDLPNELLRLFMEYLPSPDLFRGFFDLNQRLNTILRSLHYRIDVRQTNRSEFDFVVGGVLPNIDLHWIESLYINDIMDRLHSIEPCKHLRSLAIHHLRTQTIARLANHVLPTLKKLTHLRLSSELALKDSDVNILTAVVFSVQMPSLTFCHFAFEDFGHMKFDHLTTTNRSLSLKCLIIDHWCGLRDFLQLLHCVPNIHQLTVRLFDHDLYG